MNIEALLETISEDAPSGENLEYDADFSAMEIAAEAKGEQQMGDEVIAAAEPKYEDVKSLALSLLERSHDLRAAMHLAQAELKLTGLQGFGHVTSYVRGCLEAYWDSCHPQLDADENDDPTMRINCVKALSAADGIVRSLRMAPLTDSRAFGRFSYRDIEIASGVRAAPADMESVPTMDAIKAAFKDTDADALAAIQATLTAIQDDIRGIDAVFDDKTPGYGPDLGAVSTVLSEQIKHVAEMSGVPVGDTMEDDTVEDVNAAPSSGSPAAGTVGGINGPNDVVNALDRIMEYYARCEPSSPLPILLERAKRLVNADFLTIMKDMAPSGVENVNVIGGIEPGDEY